MKEWQKRLVEEWQLRLADKAQQGPGESVASSFPLIEQNFDVDEILAMTEVVLSGQYTMSHRVREFERKFAEWVGAPFAVMVNSGSSANLLALSVAANPMRGHRLNRGDEVLVPSVCWSTSVWPLVQLGLKPVFVDVDPRTLNVSIDSLKACASSRVRGMVAVHILGNCAPMDSVLAFAKDKNWIVVEDTCESLGSKWKGRYLGTLGDMGTYSFYFSHHMTTGEGGMVVCRSQEDYDLLKCLRAHGWSRELSNRHEVESNHSDIDHRFLFVNVGYNFRPMEIQAALGLKQLEKLSDMNRNRVANWQKLAEAMHSHPRWKQQFHFPQAPDGCQPVWFGFPAILGDQVDMSLSSFLKALTERGVENRPIVSGNFARQPGLALFDTKTDWKELIGAEQVHQRGFFIGVHAHPLSDSKIRDLADRLLTLV